MDEQTKQQIIQLTQQLQQTNAAVQSLTRELTVLRRLVNKIDDVTEEINIMGLGRQVDQIQDTLSTVAGVVNTAAQRANDALVEVQGLRATEIIALDNRSQNIRQIVNRLETKIDALTTAMTTMQTDITAIKTQVGA